MAQEAKERGGTGSLASEVDRQKNSGKKDDEHEVAGNVWKEKRRKSRDK